MKSFKFISLATMFVPVIAFAQAGPNTLYIDSWIGHVRSWLSIAITVIMVFMTLYFLFTVLRFIMAKSGDATDVSNKKKSMINALIGLFVAVSVWGIIRLAGNIFQIGAADQGTQIRYISCPPGQAYQDPASGGDGTCR